MPYNKIAHLPHVPEETTVLFEVTEEQQNPMQGYVNVCEYRECGKEFWAKTSRKKYCCDAHKMAEHYERKQDKE